MNDDKDGILSSWLLFLMLTSDYFTGKRKALRSYYLS